MRSQFACLLMGVLGMALSGCATRAEVSDASRAVERGELAPLDRFVGSWESVDGSGKSLGRRKSAWTLGGHVMKHSGSRFLPDGRTLTWIEYQTWSPAEHAFVSRYFDDDGATARVITRFTADSRSFEQSDETEEANGTVSVGHGSGEFLDADNIRWTWEEGGRKITTVSRRR